MNKVPVIVNGRIDHYITPYQYKKVSFWAKHQQAICEWLTLAALMAIVELMFIRAI
jgi:hypothetical protein